ncbi:MAG: hypothetical protein KBD48_02840 [Candidatus Pacebacteria bacterium]|nr:hypothetical protein [Candidatus Paceibacterota bacterium]MBP9716100.1 hypothetical protein [Candidatus Paceibacterota bacterium]
MAKNIITFENREYYLEKKIRYYDPEHRFEIMMYRSNLLFHTRKVSAIVDFLIPVAQAHYENFDVKLARLIPIYHDDNELVSKRGDVSLQLKIQMDDEQRLELDKEEMQAINILCREYPKKIEGYKTKEILMHALHKNSREAQLVSFADKHDGWCESIHEKLAGNDIFLEPVMNYPKDFFIPRREKFPLIKDLFDSELAQKNPFFQFSVWDMMQYFQNGRLRATPHNEETLKRNSMIPSYEQWKKIVLSLPNGFNELTVQKEFH